MARTKSVGSQIRTYLQSSLDEAYNSLIATVLSELATREVSPVDTGFFASSWLASTKKPQAEDDIMLFEPWASLKKARDSKGNQYVATSLKGLNSVIKPRYLAPAFRYTQPVFIGNTVDYAVFALEDGRIQRYVQGYKLKQAVQTAFAGRRRGAIQVAGRGLIGAYSGRKYIDYDKI